MSTQLSLVDAAGALRDAESTYARIAKELDDVAKRSAVLEEELTQARRGIGTAKEALYAAATAEKVVIL